MLDPKDIEAITQAVEKGVTRSRTKFLEGLVRTLLGLVMIVAVPFFIYEYGSTILVLLAELLSKRH